MFKTSQTLDDALAGCMTENQTYRFPAWKQQYDAAKIEGRTDAGNGVNSNPHDESNVAGYYGYEAGQLAAK